MSTSESIRAATGIDVGAGRVHAVRLVGDEQGGWVVTRCYTGAVGEAMVDLCTGVARVAVDAPGGLSVGSHLHDRSVAPKFRTGRCSEIPVRGVPAVSWVTPSERSDAPGWMLTGFEVWELLRRRGTEVVETFPAAGFHRLNGGRWPPSKAGPAGRSARLALLRARMELPVDAEGWGHDYLDAAMAALVAASGDPMAHSCARPDGSSMWLPTASPA